jgi:hypothetical protein
MARLGARSGPSVITALRGFKFSAMNRSCLSSRIDCQLTMEQWVLQGAIFIR